MTPRAIRRFTDEPVTEDEIMICQRAAVQAPSGGLAVPVITDAQTKRAVGERLLTGPAIRDTN
jgi:nitroreductase